jgi:hypothetical protein
VVLDGGGGGYASCFEREWIWLLSLLRGLFPAFVRSGSSGGHRLADVHVLATANDGAMPVPSAGVAPDVAAAAKAAHAVDISALDWDAWFYGTGMPPVELAFDCSERDRVNAHADEWIYKTPSAEGSTAVVTASWGAMQWIAFCERLVQVMIWSLLSFGYR